MRIRKDDIIPLLSKKIGYPEDIIKFVINDLWGTVNVYVKTPGETYDGHLHLDGFMQFLINPRWVNFKIGMGWTKESEIKLYELLQKQFKNGEGQTRKGNKHEGSS